MSTARSKLIKIVLDTNVLVSALVFGGTPLEILIAGAKGRVQIFVSPFILQEVSGVLRQKFGWGQKKVSEAIVALSQFCVLVQPKGQVEVIKGDPSDNRIFECALAAAADYLVSGDKRHILPLKKIGLVQIVAPAKFAEFLK